MDAPEKEVKLEVNFRSAPSARTKARKYDILRTPAKGIGNLALLGDGFRWQELHYWRGKSVPHNEHWCEPCEYSCELRERGYIACSPRNVIDIQILEVTDQCGDAIAEAVERFHTLRGLVVNLIRKESKANGKLKIAFTNEQIHSDLLPTSPNVEEVMRRVWGLGRSGPMVPVDRTLDTAVVRCQVRDPSLNGRSN